MAMGSVKMDINSDFHTGHSLFFGVPLFLKHTNLETSSTAALE